jgi:hypothetical protein
MRNASMLLCLLAGLAGAACGDSNSTSPSSTTTTPVETTELFSGTLSPRGSSFYSFSVTSTGTVSVTLASTASARIGPAGSSRLTIAFGAPSGFGCATTTAVDTTPGLSAQLTNGNTAAGIYCINVSDPGQLAADTLFVIRIVHT